MVRKRTRKYDSDDNDSDSDLDFDFNAGSHQPAPKKYSLRERKRAPTFTTDFDYYGLDEDEERKQSSDDEDFEVEADVAAAGDYESDSGPQNSEGLIDFEDIIRADIVVNKNKIDYDNLIQKTEIKLTQPKRRGRKPKNYVEPAEETKSPTDIFENEMHTLAPLENEDEEKKDIIEPEISFCEGEVALPNGDSLENGDCNKVVDESGFSDPLALRHTNNVETAVGKAPSAEESLQKAEEEKIGDDEDDDVIVLGELKQDVIVLDD